MTNHAFERCFLAFNIARTYYGPPYLLYNQARTDMYGYLCIYVRVCPHLIARAYSPTGSGTLADFTYLFQMPMIGRSSHRACMPNESSSRVACAYFTLIITTVCVYIILCLFFTCPLTHAYLYKQYSLSSHTVARRTISWSSSLRRSSTKGMTEFCRDTNFHSEIHIHTNVWTEQPGLVEACVNATNKILISPAQICACSGRSSPGVERQGAPFRTCKRDCNESTKSNSQQCGHACQSKHVSDPLLFCVFGHMSDP
jgi:hypothetical protein